MDANDLARYAYIHDHIHPLAGHDPYKEFIPWVINLPRQSADAPTECEFGASVDQAIKAGA